MKGATPGVVYRKGGQGISIRAPNERSDGKEIDKTGKEADISIRAPNERSDSKSAHFYNCI